MNLLKFQPSRTPTRGFAQSPSQSLRTTPMGNPIILKQSKSPHHQNNGVFESNFIHRVNKLLSSNKDTPHVLTEGNAVNEEIATRLNTIWKPKRVTTEPTSSEKKVQVSSPRFEVGKLSSLVSKDRRRQLEISNHDSITRKPERTLGGMDSDSRRIPNHILSPKTTIAKNAFLQTECAPKEDVASSIIQKLNEKLNMLSPNHSRVGFINRRTEMVLKTLENQGILESVTVKQARTLTIAKHLELNC